MSLSTPLNIQLHVGSHLRSGQQHGAVLYCSHSHTPGQMNENLVSRTHDDTSPPKQDPAAYVPGTPALADPCAVATSKRENKSSGVDCRTRLEDRVVLALVESALVLEAVVVLGLVSVYRLSVRSQLELTTALASPTLVLAPP